MGREEPSNFGPEEALSEASHARAALERAVGSLARPSGVRARSIEATPGARLVGLAGADAAMRFDTAISLEPHVPARGDHAALIVIGSALLEDEITRTVLEPARAVAPALLETLLEEGPRRGAQALEAWLDGRCPPTLGLGNIALLALRRAHARGHEGVRRFFDERYVPSFGAHVREKRLASSLDRLRDEFRNPAAHGKTTFDVRAYEAFLDLLVGHRRLARWEVEGSREEALAAGRATLVHSLLATRTRTDEASAWWPPRQVGDPVDALVALANAPGWSVDVSVSPAAAARDLVGAATPARPKARLGDAVVIRLWSARACYAALLDVGTSGTLAWLWPNGWASTGRLESDLALTLPCAGMPPLRLSGRTGTERLVLIASADPLAVTSPISGYRVIDRPALGALVDSLRALPASKLAVAAAELEVLP